MLMNSRIHDGCVTLILVGKWMCGFHYSCIEFERMDDIRQLLSTATTMDVLVDVTAHKGGTHCVAFLPLLYNEVKSPQDKPLDSYSHYIARY